MDAPAQERIVLPFLSPVDWTMPGHIGVDRSSLLSLLNQILISWGKPVRDTSRNNTLPDI